MLEGSANGTGRAHKLAIHSTPEIHYGSNGFRFYTCFEVPLHRYYPTCGRRRPIASVWPDIESEMLSFANGRPLQWRSGMRR